MKSLDEVIDDFEKACDLERRCEDCSGCLGQEEGCPNDGAESIPDALHYLKVLKDILDPLKVKKNSHEITCPQCNSVIAIILPESNEPLTWDELKAMEGKPVWVEEQYRNGDLKSSGWWLIDFWNDDQICLRDQGGNPWVMYQAGMGWAWQAYRKERG